MARLGTLFTIASGGTPDKKHAEYYENGSIPWVKTGDLKEKYVQDGIECITEQGVKNSSAKLFPPNTVLVAMYGATIGACSILPYEATTNQACAAFLPTPDVLPDYLYYFLCSKKEQFVKDGAGGAQPNISASYLKNVEMEVPSLQDQHIVIAILNKAQELISLRKQQIAKLDELVKARFVEMFEGKYESLILGDVLKTTSGGTPSKTHSEYYENGTIPWLSSGEVNAGIISTVKSFITQAGVDNSSAKMIPENSVVIAMYGATAGQVGLLRIATTTNQAVCSVLPDDRYIPEYLYYAIKSKKEWMISQCAGGAQPNISQGVIKRMKIINAPYDKQRQFAAFVAQTDQQKLTIQQSLDKMETLKKALMQKYFG